MSVTVGIVLFEDAEELDWAGPWEVFCMAKTSGDTVVTIAERPGPITCAKGLRVLPDHTFTDAPPLDILTAAGLTAGKRVTTHWGSLEELRRRGADPVLENVRYVRDGNLVTSAGVSAGIDMALWLVGQVYGVDHARVTQYAMEYDPAPPYAALV